MPTLQPPRGTKGYEGFTQTDPQHFATTTKSAFVQHEVSPPKLQAASHTKGPAEPKRDPTVTEQASHASIEKRESFDRAANAARESLARNREHINELAEAQRTVGTKVDNPAEHFRTTTASSYTSPSTKSSSVALTPPKQTRPGPSSVVGDMSPSVDTVDGRSGTQHRSVRYDAKATVAEPGHYQTTQQVCYTPQPKSNSTREESISYTREAVSTPTDSTHWHTTTGKTFEPQPDGSAIRSAGVKGLTDHDGDVQYKAKPVNTTAEVGHFQSTHSNSFRRSKQ